MKIRMPLFLIVKGGLGNQLFMYSYGLSLSERTNKKLYLVGNWYDTEQRAAYLVEFKRNFELIKFPNIGHHVCKNNSLFSRFVFFMYRLATKYPILLSKIGIVNVDKKQNKDKFMFIIYGYGHELKEFRHLQSRIKENLKLDSLQGNQVKNYVKKIRSDRQTLIAMHIRRGDSVLKDNFSNVLSIDYYNYCITKFNLNNTLFLIFSDDINWCKDIFKGNFFYFIEESDPVLSLNIGIHCDGYILSASSFSWWMAWLTNSTSPIVYYPDEPNFKMSNLGQAFEIDSWIGVKTIFEVSP